MSRHFQTGAAISAILAMASLSACGPAATKPSLAANTPVQAAPGVRPAPAVTAMAAPTPVPAPKPAKPHVFTLNTPVERIAADPRGKAVLDRDVPGLMANKNYPMFDDMSLSEIALVSGGKLTRSKLELVKSDLIQISYLPPSN
jgi:hypothetical protein